MTIQHLEGFALCVGLGFALGVGLCTVYGIWYRHKLVVPLLKLVEEMAPWLETKKLQDGQDAFLAGLTPEDQPAEMARQVDDRP